MRERDAFSGLHPAVNFTYFGLVLICSMLFMHPAMLIISLGCAALYGISLKGREMLKSLKFILPVMVLTAVLNPLFSHKGTTILFYFSAGNPMTLESVIYGLAASFMMCAVMLWFVCLTEVITPEKILFLFGKSLPSLALVLTMTLQFIPKFKERFNCAVQAQKLLGRDIDRGRLSKRAKNLAVIFSVMVSWSLEDAAETADSMKSRGYGCGKRSFFNIYKMSSLDKKALVFLSVCGCCIFYGYFSGAVFWQYYPYIKLAPMGAVNVSVIIVYLLLCLAPAAINLREDRKWQKLKSKT